LENNLTEKLPRINNRRIKLVENAKKGKRSKSPGRISRTPYNRGKVFRGVRGDREKKSGETRVRAGTWALLFPPKNKVI